MNRPLRILSIVWNLIRGGTEGQCARVAMESQRRGYDHRVAVFRPEGHFLPAVEEVCGSVYHFDVRHMVAPDTFRKIHGLAGWIQREGFDVVHTWDADASIFASIAARQPGIPLITSRRDLGAIYPWYKRHLMKRADRQARAVVVNAEAIRACGSALGIAPDKIRLITNILDLEEFDHLAAHAGQALPDLLGRRIVGHVARLDAEKDVATFVRAAALVHATHRDVLFVVAGDGPERPTLQALAAELGADEYVQFLGDIPEVPALNRKLIVGALVPRSNEGLSNTILEYMAAGLPVVATDCGGNGELVCDGETGYLVPIGHDEAVAAALNRLLDHPEQAVAMGQKGRARVQRDNGPGTVTQQFLDLYSAVSS